MNVVIKKPASVFSNTRLTRSTKKVSTHEDRNVPNKLKDMSSSSSRQRKVVPKEAERVIGRKKGNPCRL